MLLTSTSSPKIPLFWRKETITKLLVWCGSAAFSRRRGFAHSAELASFFFFPGRSRDYTKKMARSWRRLLLMIVSVTSYPSQQNIGGRNCDARKMLLGCAVTHAHQNFRITERPEHQGDSLFLSSKSIQKGHYFCFWSSVLFALLPGCARPTCPTISLLFSRGGRIYFSLNSPIRLCNSFPVQLVGHQVVHYRASESIPSIMSSLWWRTRCLGLSGRCTQFFFLLPLPLTGLKERKRN